MCDEEFFHLSALFAANHMQYVQNISPSDTQPPEVCVIRFMDAEMTSQISKERLNQAKKMVSSIGNLKSDGLSARDKSISPARRATSQSKEIDLKKQLRDLRVLSAIANRKH